MAVNLGSAYGEIILDASGAVKGINTAKGAMGSLTQAGAQVGAAMAAAGASLTLLGGVALRASIQMESGFAGIIKTTDGLADSTGNLTKAGAAMRQEFSDMGREIPATYDKLFQIGELGGQLGIAREALGDFTESIAALDVSTNLTADEAATALARLANIFDVTAADMGENVERMGSTIVDLGNNFATTERDIVSFAERIAGAGRIAGLTQAQVLAIGTALSSVGVEAEAGGTAVQKVLLAMNEAVVDAGDSLQVFAETAGLTAEQFSAMWEEDAAGAFQLFVEGLGDAGDDAIKILDALELSDQRLVRAFLSLSNAGDLLGETLDRSAIAWEENSALAKEAGQRYGTLASQFQTFKNDAQDTAAVLGDDLRPAVGGVLELGHDLLAWVRDLPGPVRETAVRRLSLARFQAGC